MIYCISCKKKTNDINIKPKITKNNKPYILANCSVCKKSKSQFVSINQIKGMVFYPSSFEIFQY